MNFSATLPDLAATQAFAARMAHALQAPLAIGLVGDLGAGKTALARALIQTLAPGMRVKSPTYALVESYELPGLHLHHLDLYRIRRPDELAELGLAELAGADAILLIEWPDRGGDQTPSAGCRGDAAARGHRGAHADLVGSHAGRESVLRTAGDRSRRSSGCGRDLQTCSENAVSERI